MSDRHSEAGAEARTALRHGVAIAGAVLVAIAGAQLWRWCHLPLPWLVGSLYAVAMARVLGLLLLAPPGARELGQWVVGINMGLYFTSAVASEVASHAFLIIGMAFASLLAGFVGAEALVRCRLADRPTAFFAAMPGGASEMANLSDRWMASVDRVAAAHAMRVMLVVLVVPLALTLTDTHGTNLAPVETRELVWQRLALMAAASLAGVGAFTLLRLPNAWLLGTLFAVAGLGIGGTPLSGLPAGLGAAGQLLIGVSLGCRFGPGFFHKAPAFLAGILILSLGFLASTTMLAFLLTHLTHLTFPDLLLSFAPGGIAEMSLTATQLHLAVPLVVAAHVVRLAILTLLAPAAFRIFSRWRRTADRQDHS